MIFSIDNLAEDWRKTLDESYDELWDIQSRYSKEQLEEKVNRIKKATEEEQVIVNSNKENLESLKPCTPEEDQKHGDIKDKIYGLYIDIKCSKYNIASIRQDSIEKFNPEKLINHYYICINLETREAIFVEHLYLYNLIKSNKLLYQSAGQGDNFIGEIIFNQILSNPILCDKYKIKKINF